MSDVISWDKAIDKKVKSSDDKDLGKIQSITRDYIQTKEGTISKNYYFIPKYYITGYDGDNLWVSLTRDEVRSRFEKEKAPELSEFQTPEYEARRTEVTRQYPEFETTIPAFARQTEGVPLSWDKIIDRKIKSSDNKDLGKVESISTDYIETREGTVSKKHYYIPKYYVQGFDGNNLHAALTKDEVKDRYERESPPSPSEFKSQEYMEQVRRVESTYPQFVHGVPWMAREPDTEIPVDYSGTTYNIPWSDIIHKRVRTTDDVDMGYIERIGNEFIVVREGTADAHIYYVPKTYIRDYDGQELTVDAPGGLVRAKFERDGEPSVEELRALARQAPRYRRVEGAQPAADPGSVTVEESIDLDRTKTAESS
jgi:hypothetical protein